MSLTAQEIAQQRAAIVAEALTWRGTPYVPEARVKGGGCDCLTLIAGIFETVLGPIDVPHYAKDWHQHNTAELYLEGKDGEPGVLGFCVEVDAPPARAPLPGDIVLWKFGHTFSHGAVVIDWPVVIQSYSNRPVSREDAVRSGTLARYFENIAERGQPRPRRFFTLRQWAE
ncbi:MAG: hypothetical protein ACREEN_00645 [Stellaceae bacterium]